MRMDIAGVRMKGKDNATKTKMKCHKSKSPKAAASRRTPKGPTCRDGTPRGFAGWEKWMDQVEQLLLYSIKRAERLRLDPKVSRWGRQSLNTSIKKDLKLLKQMGVKVVVVRTKDPVKPFFLEISRTNRGGHGRTRAA